MRARARRRPPARVVLVHGVVHVPGQGADRSRHRRGAARAAVLARLLGVQGVAFAARARAPGVRDSDLARRGARTVPRRAGRGATRLRARLPGRALDLLLPVRATRPARRSGARRVPRPSERAARHRRAAGRTRVLLERDPAGTLRATGLHRELPHRGRGHRRGARRRRGDRGATRRRAATRRPPSRSGVMATYALLGAGEFEPWSEVVDRAILERSPNPDGTVLVLPTASAHEGETVFRGWGDKGVEHYRALGL